MIAALHEQTVGVHLYPLSACVTPRGRHDRRAALGARRPTRLVASAWVVADASAAGVPAIISEANSASCGGVAGVSDSPAIAVWAVRFVLAALKTGFQEVRFHFSGAPYDPFVVSGEAGAQASARERAGSSQPLAARSAASLQSARSACAGSWRRLIVHACRRDAAQSSTTSTRRSGPLCLRGDPTT